MRIGIYCGSFNPVHKGHIKIVRRCLRKKLLDKVLIVPTGDYWHKTGLLEVDRRIEMLKLFKSKRIEIDETHNNIQFTTDIFKQLAKDYPKDELVLILGADNLPRFHEWNNYEYLLAYDFIVVKRAENGSKAIRKYMKNLGKENYEILSMPKINASSSYIRKNISDYRKVRRMLSKRVWKMMQ